METKPVISCDGDPELIKEMQHFCSRNLPMEPTEWNRKQGRTLRTVHVDVNFETFSPDSLVVDKTEMVGRPAAHIYILPNNIELYRSTGKAHLGQWLGHLRSRTIAHWLIVCVSSEPVKVKSKLLPQKSTVLDKIKSDMNIKPAEKHMIMVADKSCGDQRSYSDTWGDLLTAVRNLVLDSYDIILVSYEDQIRGLREKRFDQSWNYFEYFALQEELASIYESLSLYEDALIQYDELEAVFAQCIEGYKKGERQSWLLALAGLPCTRLDLVVLAHYSDPMKRCQIRARCVCVFDFRAYLLSRQCALLQLCSRTKDIAARALDVVLSTLKEAKLLEVEIRPSLLDAWVFLCCLQSIHTSQRFDDTGQAHCSTASAELWRHTTQRLGELGSRCGLMPTDKPSSDGQKSQEGKEIDNRGEEQKAESSFLRSAMQQLDPEEFEGHYGETPYHRLALALSSPKNFQKVYVELMELSLGLFKHIGRLRTVRWMGCDLADFFVKIGNFVKAESLYSEALTIYKKESWPQLASSVRLKLARCQKQIKSGQLRYLKTCLYLASSTSQTSRVSVGPGYRTVPPTCQPQISFTEREHYWTEAETILTNPEAVLISSEASDTEVNCLPCFPLVELVSVGLELESDQRNTDGKQIICVEAISNAPKVIHLKSLWISANQLPIEADTRPHSLSRIGGGFWGSRANSLDNVSTITSELDAARVAAPLNPIPLTPTNFVIGLSTPAMSRTATPEPTRRLLGQSHLNVFSPESSRRSLGNIQATPMRQPSHLTDTISLHSQAPSLISLQGRHRHPAILKEYRKAPNGAILGVRIESRDPTPYLSTHRVSVGSLPAFNKGEFSKRLLQETDTRFSKSNVDLEPGTNKIFLLAEKHGFFVPLQMGMNIGSKICLVERVTDKLLTSSWKNEQLLDHLLPKIEILNPRSLFVGLDECIEVVLKSGSLHLPSDTRLDLISLASSDSVDSQIMPSLLPHTSHTLEKSLTLRAQSQEDQFAVRLHGWRFIPLSLNFIQPFTFVTDFHGIWDRQFVRVCIGLCDIPTEAHFTLVEPSLSITRNTDEDCILLPLVDPELASGTVTAQWTFSFLWAVPPGLLLSSPTGSPPQFFFSCHVSRAHTHSLIGSQKPDTSVISLSHQFRGYSTTLTDNLSQKSNPQIGRIPLHMVQA